GTDGSLRHSLTNIELLTSDEGHLNQSLANIDRMTTDLVRQDKINATLNNFQQASRKLSVTIDNLGPQFEAIGKNLEQATDTVKRQPWRLVWPSTKKYPTENAPLPAEQQPRRSVSVPATPRNREAIR